MKLLPEGLWGGVSRAGVQERVKQQLAFSFAAISRDHISLRGESFSNSTLGEEREKERGIHSLSFRKDLKDLFIMPLPSGSLL